MRLQKAGVFFRFANVLCLVALFIGNATVHADMSGCGTLKNHFGPFDYHSSPPDRISLVENAHFTPDVEYLRRGQSTAVIGADINYTLHVFPNHPRALLAMSNLALREKTSKPRGSNFTVDCWFERALQFRDSDSTVRMLYGIHLLRTNRTKLALDHLKAASELNGDDAGVSYNLGLAYFEMKDYARSLQYAHQAYNQGFPLPGLKNKLIRAGKWTDPVPRSAPAVGDDANSSGSASN